jgi:hypothetical protein
VIKVGLASNWDLQCGNAEYARDLKRELEKEFEVVELPAGLAQLRRDGVLDSEIKVVLVNWTTGPVDFVKEDIEWMQNAKVKVVLLDHNYVGTLGALRFGADAYVAHEPEKDTRYSYIPHGIPEVPVAPVLAKRSTVGSAGFPFSWKRFDVVASAAKRMNAHCRIMAPRSVWMDTDAFVESLVADLGELSEVSRDWLPKETVVWKLSECVANIFWFQSQGEADERGQSGSVRMGLAARRPVIISTHRKFKTLFSYEDELYICGREEEVYAALEEICCCPRLAKRPNRLLEDMGWGKCGEKYRTLIKEMVV